MNDCDPIRENEADARECEESLAYGRTCKEWCDYLTARCREEGVELWLTPPELSGWVSAGVDEADDEDEVFAALQESLNDTE